MSLTASLDQKIQWMKETVNAVLDAHGYEFKVSAHMRAGFLTLDTNIDAKKYLGSPVRYARIWFDGVEDRPREQKNEGYTLYGSRAKVSHRIGCLIEFGFEDNDDESLSSEKLFRNLLERDEEGSPIGLFVHLRNLGFSLGPGDASAIELAESCPAELGVPENIVLPSFPVGSQGEGDSYVHYVEFTITIT